MSDRELIRSALHDAIDWQLSLYDAHGKDDEWGKVALEKAKKYRSLLKRRYGISSQPQEALDNLKMVSLDELRRMAGDAPTQFYTPGDGGQRDD